MWLELGLTDHERDLVADQVDDPMVRESGGNGMGLAEYVGGGPWALDWFKTGSIEQPIRAACLFEPLPTGGAPD